MSQAGAPRLDPRVRLRLRIDVTPRWSGALPVRMETVDLSGNGAALQSPIFLPLKTQVSIALTLPAVGGRGVTSIACEAVVVNIEEIGHTRERWRAGVYFLNLSKPEQEALRRFVYSALEVADGRQASPAARSGGSMP